MTGRGQNRGFQVLDEFVCDAIPSPSITPADPTSQGRNEGLAVVAEVVFDAAPEANPTDKAKRVVGIGEVAKPLRTGWADLFSGAAAAAVFSGLVGGVLRAVGAVAVIQQTRSTEKACRVCGRPDPAYSLRCCQSPACENCLSGMLRPDREDGVGFRCTICGHIHSETA
jgi:hypothetical protein